MTPLQMQRQQLKTSKNIKNQENIVSLKEQNTFPVTNSKDMEICYLSKKISK